MKKKILILLCLVFSVGGNVVCGQTLERAEAEYVKFNNMRLQGGAKEDMYSVLMQCYNDYVEVVKGNSPDSPEYNQAKRGLRNIYSFLQMAAAHYSSRGNNNVALTFVQAYMDIPLMAEFKGESFTRDNQFPTMAYIAAAGSFNRGNYNKAIAYFDVYLETEDKKMRQDVYTGMVDAYRKLEKYEYAIEVLNRATMEYPNDFELLKKAINICLEIDDQDNLQKFISKGLKLNPNHEALLLNQGLLHERKSEYQKALNVYKKLDAVKPNQLKVYQHIAENYFNLGVLYYNKADMESNENIAKKYRHQSNDYFAGAAATLETITVSRPDLLQYSQALAVAYSCLGNTSELDKVNRTLSDVGVETVSENVVPQYVSNKTVKQDVVKHEMENNVIPDWQKYLKNYVESNMKKWMQKGEFENNAAYQSRVTQQNQDLKLKELMVLAETEYIKTYAKSIRLNDMVLNSYDADHETFKIGSRYGDLVLSVPNQNNEAIVFKNSWSGMQFKNSQFFIDNGGFLAIKELLFVTPTGNSYLYDATQTATYVPYENKVGDFEWNNPKEDVYVVTKSDVDVNIPVAGQVNEKTFAIIIANENYTKVAKVPFAENDGKVFSEYCEKTLGIKKNHIFTRLNASYGDMLDVMDKIREKAIVRQGDINVIFYYAGHGVPDEASKEAYLVPTDANAKRMDACFSLNQLYKELGELNAKSVYVFLDACFSGATREGTSVNEGSRAIVVKPKPNLPQGNTVVFSAVSNEQTALPYKEKCHGMFTYFLLKMLQESKGNITLKELKDYLSTQVSINSDEINDKIQTPTVNTSVSLRNNWEQMKLNNK